MENNFTKALQKIMDERGLTPYQLSRVARTSPTQMNSWLMGKSLPHYKSIQQLCRFLKVNAGVFFD